MDNEDDEDRPSRLPRRAGVWGWLILAAGAVVGAIALGLYLGLRADTPPPSPTAGPAAQTSSAPAPEIVAATAVQRAIEAYQLRATLFTNHQMTCSDLATGLAEVDARWLAYTLASPPAATGDTAAAKPGGGHGLEADVDQVEADFERSGCPRP